MKLARKLTLALLAVMVAVLAFNAFERVRRDRATVHADIRRDHRALGHALSVVVREAFFEDGDTRALALVEAANQREGSVQVAWRWLPSSAVAPELEAAQRASLRRGQDVDVVVQRGGAAWLISYYPLWLPGRPLGLIEVSESLAAEAEAVRSTLVRTAISTLVVGLLAALLTHVLGLWLVGRPVAALMEKARRVGAGDLSGPIQLSQRDELSDLAREMNAMCARLDAESRARQHALEQLRHAERLATLGRLAAGVAHELGTPLNVVTLEAKRIASGRAQGADAQEGALIIGSQATRMADIIRQLLDFAGRRAPRPSRQDLASLTRDTLSLLGSLASQKNVTIELEERDAVSVDVDPGQLKQVVTNLVVNAIQAMPNGGLLRIETALEEPEGAGGACAALRVIDTGVGIAEADLARIFEPFYTTKDVGQGTGLGLAVAHGIVEEHGGSIKVESCIGVGSTFAVRLPLRNRESS